MKMKEKIRKLRFGLLNINSLTDDEILEVMDYYVTPDVLELCQSEIFRRCESNLRKSNTG